MKGEETEVAENIILRGWCEYKNFVTKRTHTTENNTQESITYWRDALFSKLIVYLLPICIIALIPCVYVSVKSGHQLIGVVDIVAACLVALVSLSKKFDLVFKKVFLLSILYLLAIVLIIGLGSAGPGTVYLLTIGIIAALIFPTHIAYWSIAMNLLICTGFATITYFKLFNFPLVHEYGIQPYIAVSSNLIFLSWVSILLISTTVSGLESIINKAEILKEELEKETAGRMRTKQILRESNDHYKSLFISNPSPMWVLDNATNQFLQVNDAAIKSYGYTNEEFLSMTIKDIKLEEDMAALYQHVKENRESGVPFRLHAQHRRKNKELFPVEIMFNTIPFEGREARLVIALDMTEQMIYATALENQNNKLREIAHIQSHNVRGPLATIMGLTLLFKENPADPQMEEIIEGICISSENLDNAIKDIINKSNIAEQLYTTTILNN